MRTGGPGDEDGEPRTGEDRGAQDWGGWGAQGVRTGSPGLGRTGEPRTGEDGRPRGVRTGGLTAGLPPGTPGAVRLQAAMAEDRPHYDIASGEFLLTV